MDKKQTNQKNRPGFRHCTRCKKEFPLEKFCRNVSDAKGRSHLCAPCGNKHVNEWYHKNKEHARAYQDRKRREYIQRNMKIVKSALNSMMCSECGDEKPLRFKSPDRKGYFDPVMSVAKSGRPVAVVEETISNCKPVCLTCS